MPCRPHIPAADCACWPNYLCPNWWAMVTRAPKPLLLDIHSNSIQALSKEQLAAKVTIKHDLFKAQD